MTENTASSTGAPAAGTQDLKPGTAQTGAGTASTSVDQIQNGQAGTFTVPPEMIEWAKSKGYADPQKLFTDPDAYRMANSYRQTESFLGGDKLPLPKDPNDAAAMSAVYDKLGRPQSPDQYTFKASDGATDTPLVKFAQPLFHEAGLNDKQANTIVEGWNKFNQDLIAQDDARVAEQAAAETAGLQKDWGTSYEQNQKDAALAWNRIASDLGIARDKLDALQEAFGVRDSMRLFHYVFDVMKPRGDSFEGTGIGTRMNASSQIDQAMSQKAALMQDKEFGKKIAAGDPEARSKLQALNSVIAAAQAA